MPGEDFETGSLESGNIACERGGFLRELGIERVGFQ